MKKISYQGLSMMVVVLSSVWDISGSDRHTGRQYHQPYQAEQYQPTIQQTKPYQPIQQQTKPYQATIQQAKPYQPIQQQTKSYQQTKPYQPTQQQTPVRRQSFQRKFLPQQSHYRKPSNKAYRNPVKRPRQNSYRKPGGGATTPKPAGLDITGALSTFIEGKLLPFGFVRVDRALKLCEDKGRELVTEGLQTIRAEGEAVISQLEERVEERCRGFLTEAEQQCSGRIEIILDRFQTQLKDAVKDGQEQCAVLTERAVKLTRDESERTFKQLEMRERMNAEEEFKRRADEARMKAEAEFMRRAEEEFEKRMKEAKDEFKRRADEARAEAKKEFLKRKDEGEEECKDMIKKGCGNGTDREEFCDDFNFFTGNIDDFYEYNDDDYDDYYNDQDSN